MKLHRIRALLLKYWYFSTADLARIFDMVYWPVIGIIVFGFTTLYIEEATQVPGIMVFLLGGLFIWMLFERIQQDINIFLLEDFWSQNIANMFITPVKTTEVFTALAIIGIIRAVVTFLIMYALALFAYSFNVIGGSPTSLAFIIPLLLFGWGLGLFISGILFRYGMRIQILAWGITYIMQPIAAAYYPLASLPPSLQIAAHTTPLMYTFEGYRLAYAGTFSWWFFSVGTILAFVYLVFGYVYFVYAIKAARRKGLLSKY